LWQERGGGIQKGEGKPGSDRTLVLLDKQVKKKSCGGGRYFKGGHIKREYSCAQKKKKG